MLNRCTNCKEQIKPGEGKKLHGQTFCEDCFMDVFSPPRTCDPWAVRSATMTQGVPQIQSVNEIQGRILKILAATGGIELHTLAKELKMKPSDVERQVAALVHMKKVRGKFVNGEKIITL